MRRIVLVIAFLLASCIAPKPAEDTLYLPVIGHVVPVTDECGQSPVAAQLAFLFLTDPGQKRKDPHCDNRLVRAAQFRADDMVSLHYFSHLSPSGHSPHFYVTMFGCRLPDYYLAEGNYIESLAMNQASAADVWRDWLASPGHRRHVLGEEGTFVEQTSYGVAVAESAWGKVYVIETTPGC
jgi:hypothetical protein